MSRGARGAGHIPDGRPFMEATPRSDGEPKAPATAVCAQRILLAAVSGCSPYSCATRAAQPRSPNAQVAAVIARLTWIAVGWSERCSVDAKSASARAALMFRSYGADRIVGLLLPRGLTSPAARPAVKAADREARACLRPQAPLSNSEGGTAPVIQLRARYFWLRWPGLRRHMM
jgi:hypothetical protein